MLFAAIREQGITARALRKIQWLIKNSTRAVLLYLAGRTRHLKPFVLIALLGGRGRSFGFSIAPTNYKCKN
jgi:hypothetical protein